MIDEVKAPGKEFFSPARSIGAAMSDFMLKHPDFYLFSPDETTSNKLDAIYEFESRAWDLPQKAWDLPEAANGRIIEMLSENTLFACMVGHLMNGESAMMTSYESFFNIITSKILHIIIESSGVCILFIIQSEVRELISCHVFLARRWNKVL